MTSLKDSPWWLIISLVAVIVVGSGGVIWQYQSARLDKMKSAAELREREIVIYRDIVSLADSMSRMYAEHKTASQPELERLRAPLDAQMKMRISDYIAIERDLASLEDRAPRKIPLDFLKPLPPVDVRILRDDPDP